MLGELYLNLSPIALVVMLVFVFVAAFARGYLGFGFSAILMTGALPVLPATQLVPLSIALEVVASSSQAPRILADVHRRYLVILLSASLIGAPVGVLLLSYFSERSLRFGVYGIILVSTLILLVLKPRPLSLTRPQIFAAGLFSGIINGATALSGLVLALFFTSSTVPSKTMRATIIAYLFFTDVITVGFLLAADHFDAQTLWRILVSIPFLLAGIWLGTRQFLVTPSRSFKALVLWLLIGFCALGIAQML